MGYPIRQEPPVGRPDGLLFAPRSTGEAGGLAGVDIINFNLKPLANHRGEGDFISIGRPGGVIVIAGFERDARYTTPVSGGGVHNIDLRSAHSRPIRGEGYLFTVRRPGR